MAAAFGIVATIAGSQMESMAQNKASRIQQEAMDKSLSLQKQMYRDQLAAQAPYKRAGEYALNELQGMASRDTPFQFNQSDPSYQFRMKQGQDAIEASAAARGGYFSGQTGKELMQFGQGLASEEYGNEYNRYLSNRQQKFNELSSLAGFGPNATGQMQTAAQNYGMNASNLYGNQAAIRGMGGMNQANTWSNALAGISDQIQSGIGQYQQYQLLKDANG